VYDHVFVLRLWRDAPLADPGGGSWRVSLENPHTRHRRGFDGVEALAAFLDRITTEPERAYSAPRCSGDSREEKP